MSFLIYGDYIYITYGTQDKDGWVAKLDYQGLINSLVDINDSC